MGTSKSKKPSKKSKPTARKHAKKAPGKASTAKAAKIKLSIGGRPTNETTEASSVKDSANKDLPVEISSLLSS